MAILPLPFTSSSEADVRLSAKRLRSDRREQLVSYKRISTLEIFRLFSTVPQQWRSKLWGTVCLGSSQKKKSITWISTSLDSTKQSSNKSWLTRVPFRSSCSIFWNSLRSSRRCLSLSWLSLSTPANCSSFLKEYTSKVREQFLEEFGLFFMAESRFHFLQTRNKFPWRSANLGSYWTMTDSFWEKRMSPMQSLERN